GGDVPALPVLRAGGGGVMAAQAWVDHPQLVDFYASHRSRPEDLYPSERRFLPWLAGQSDRVLDAGCGAGGFAGIWRHFNPVIGVDGEICFATFVLERAPADEGGRPPLVAAELPFAWPPALAGSVDLQPDGALAQLVPEEDS